ncbi:MAG: hypothetical protein MUE96_07375 [Bacteroidia bacterium]|jgi:hypothetical protein|nr:hypothetical protein [Bacteroidia bacterium]
MKHAKYLLFAFILCQVCVAYSIGPSLNSQNSNCKYHKTVSYNGEEDQHSDNTSVATEQNEEDDAKCCRLNLYTSPLNMAILYLAVVGKTIASNPNKILEPPCNS